MRKILLSLFLVSSSSFAAVVETDTTVERVTVYPTGATIHRSAQANLTAGANVITITNLPANISGNTLQISVDGTGVQLGQIRFKTVPLSDAFNEEVNALTKKIEAEREKLNTIEDLEKSQQLTLQFLQGIAQGYAKEAWQKSAQGSAQVDSWRSAMQVLSGGSEQAYEKLRDYAKSRAALLKEIDRLQRELRQLSGSQRSSAKAELQVESAAAGSARVLMSYFTEDARWEPLYTARLNSSTGQLTLSQEAMVQQSTDESWNNVALSLSTVEPVEGLEAPEVDSQFLQLQQKEQRRRMPGISAGAPMASRVEEVVVTATRRRAEVGHYGVTYDVASRIDLANDGEAQTYDLTRSRFDAEVLSKIVPREDTQAFLTARFTYTDDIPLSYSTLRVFVDNGFAGVTEIESVLPGAEVDLPMGPDRRVEVRLQNQGGEDDEGGIINRKKTDVTHLLYQITNRHSRPTKIEVLDTIPVARHRDIEVEVDRNATTPDATDVDDQPGVIAWRKTLDSGEAWSIRQHYRVTYPADAELVVE